ncbi:MAG: hypothetical protein JNJ73_17450 [Hyphomonadaceae bacterium]|nr:hypothetical protein [Hyphomonadaceae bacterium]
MSPVPAPGMLHIETMPLNDSDPRIATFTTSLLVGFIEGACLAALRPYLAPGVTSGVRLELSQISAKPLGAKVTAIVRLIAVEGRKLTFRVDCRDEHDVIAHAVHERVTRNILAARARRDEAIDNAA